MLLADEVAAAEVEDAIDLAVLAARQISLGRIGASFGLAHQSEAGRTDDVVTLADTRMYEAKRRRQERRTQLSAG